MLSSQYTGSLFENNMENHNIDYTCADMYTEGRSLLLEQSKIVKSKCVLTECYVKPQDYLQVIIYRDATFPTFSI